MGPQHLPSCHYFIPHTIGLHHGTRKTHYIFTILLVMKMQSNFMPRIEIKSTYHSAPEKKNRKILFWLGIIFFLALSVCANVFQDKFDMRRAFETYFIVCVNYTAAAWVFFGRTGIDVVCAFIPYTSYIISLINAQPASGNDMHYAYDARKKNLNVSRWIWIEWHFRFLYEQQETERKKPHI